MAFYFLALRWSVHNVLREAGATDDDLKGAWYRAADKLVQLFGEEKAEQVARMSYKFNSVAAGAPAP